MPYPIVKYICQEPLLEYVIIAVSDSSAKKRVIWNLPLLVQLTPPCWDKGQIPHSPSKESNENNALGLPREGRGLLKFRVDRHVITINPKLLLAWLSCLQNNGSELGEFPLGQKNSVVASHLQTVHSDKPFWTASKHLYYIKIIIEKIVRRSDWSKIHVLSEY